VVWSRASARFWGGKGLGHPGSIYVEARGDLRAIADFFASLKPATEEQRELIGAAKQAFARVVETTLLMARQLGNPVPLRPVDGDAPRRDGIGGRHSCAASAQ
jgi:hypothetical protein